MKKIFLIAVVTTLLCGCGTDKYFCPEIPATFINDYLSEQDAVYIYTNGTDTIRLKEATRETRSNHTEEIEKWCECIKTCRDALNLTLKDIDDQNISISFSCLTHMEVGSNQDQEDFLLEGLTYMPNEKNDAFSIRIRFKNMSDIDSWNTLSDTIRDEYSKITLVKKQQLVSFTCNGTTWNLIEKKLLLSAKHKKSV